MAIRKSMQEEMVVDGLREDWLVICVKSLESSGFTNLIAKPMLFQIEADYRKFMTWGTILVTLIPSGNNTKIIAFSTANVDNIYALFRSPNKQIINAFKRGLL